jgi:hypothetical protein
MGTDPLTLERIKKLLDSIDPVARPYAESVVRSLWALGEQNLNVLISVVYQSVSYAQMSMSELTDALKASNDASDKLHVQTIEAKQKQAMFLQQIALSFVFMALGGGEPSSPF